MQGRKNYTEKLFVSFLLSDWIPKENLYRRLRETLDLGFLYKDTKELYGSTGNPSIDPMVLIYVDHGIPREPAGRQEYLKEVGSPPLTFSIPSRIPYKVA